MVVEEVVAPPAVPARRRPDGRRRHMQMGLAATAALMLLFVVAGDPVEATIRVPFSTEETVAHRGSVSEIDAVALRLHVTRAMVDDVTVRQQGTEVTIEVPTHRSDLGLRVRDYTPSDTLHLVLPDGTTKKAWEDAAPRPLRSGYADGNLPLESGRYLVVWSSDAPRDGAELSVDVVRLADEPVFDSAALMQKLTLTLGAVAAGAGAVVLHFRKGLGRLGDLVLDGASDLWERLRAKVDR